MITFIHITYTNDIYIQMKIRYYKIHNVYNLLSIELHIIITHNNSAYIIKIFY